ncbi:MAG: 2Fe-2S iron-sulfur cluster-binding protein [Deltaproteobacteria bacterium]
MSDQTCTVTINGVGLEVPRGINVVEAAERAGTEVPHYCYHPGLSVAGNCRICLVDIKALSDKQPNPLPKLQIACNTLVQDGMVVETDNDKVRGATRSVLEFLLINHPIDCPVCDQAGECMLQEYYMDYGGHQSRFGLADKVAKGKVLPVGPDIMLDQERCILCTRCVRFLDEVTETHELTIKERGDRSELCLGAGASVNNDYATNIVDVCPVGALTSREFRFQKRVWYLETHEAVCTGCATGCSVNVDSRQDEIYRIKPRFNPDVNGYWMCDAGRRTHLGNRNGERVEASLLRSGQKMVECATDEAVPIAARALAGAEPVAILVSADVSLEEGFLLLRLAERLGGARLLMLPAEDLGIEDDGLLISADRHPNRRGLLDLGFVETEAPPAGVAALLVVRADPAAGGGDWPVFLESLAVTTVAADRYGQTAAYADHLLAVGSHFEGQASFMNRAGLVQSSVAAVSPPGDASAGWALLAALLAEVGGDHYADAAELASAATP